MTVASLHDEISAPHNDFHSVSFHNIIQENAAAAADDDDDDESNNCDDDDITWNDTLSHYTQQLFCW